MRTTQAIHQFTHQHITPEEIDIIQHASPLVYNNMSAHQKKSIFDAVRSISADQRKDVIAHASILMQYSADGQENATLLNIMKETPSHLRKTLAREVESLLNNVKARDIACAIEAIVNLPPSERLDVVARTLSFSWDNISQATLKKVFDIILNIAPEDRDDVIERALPFLSQYDGAGGPYILKAISDIPSAKRDDVIGRALSLQQINVNKENIYCLFVAINAISTLQRDDIIELALLFMRDDMDAFDKGTILLSVQNIPEAQRKDVAQLTLSLIQNDMTGKEIAEILGTVQRMDPLQRKRILQLASPLLETNKDKKSIIILLEAIQRIPLSEQRDFVKIAASFIRGNLSPFMKLRILKSIELIPAIYRKKQADRVFIQLKIDFPHEAFEVCEYVRRLKELLKTPLDQPFPPIEQRETQPQSNPSDQLAPFDLDLRRTLLELTLSRKMSSKEIQHSLKACIKYLEDHECEKALKVLRDPSHNPADHGPFLEPFVVDGVKTSGQEVLGRLWRAMDNLPTEKMRELALRLIIDALNKCIDSDNIRISNEQKLLYLFFNLKKFNSYEETISTKSFR